MSVASHYEAKEMILTHGECERSSIVLVFVGRVGMHEERKEDRRSSKKLADI